MIDSSRRIGGVLAVATLGLAAWVAWTYCFLPKDTSTISLWHAAKTFDHCSRPGPVGGDSFWIPTAAQIRAAEAALPPMLAERRKLGLRMPQKADGGQPFHFHRQYIGFVMAGERVIYLNAYPTYEDASLNDAPFSLLEQPEVVCDGGRMFWGAVFSPRTGTFVQFATNFGGMDSPE